MKNGVPPTFMSPCGDCLAVSWRPSFRVGGTVFRAGLLLLGSLFALIFASSAFGAGASVRSGSDAAHGGSASPASKGRHDPNQAAGANGCADMCGGCMGGGGESPSKTPAVVAETPVLVTKAPVVVTRPTSGATETAAGAVSVARPAAVAPVPGPAAITLPPRTQSKTAARKPVKRTVEGRVKKHHSKASHGATEKSLARPVLPGQRPGFTG
jgi:hypothetical protein